MPSDPCRPRFSAANYLVFDDELYFRRRLQADSLQYGGETWLASDEGDTAAQISHTH